MSREIKFRAWLKEQNVMVQLYGFIKNNPETIILHYLNKDTWYNAVFMQSDVALTQYTGLKDKNGVEIYEGDILRRSHLILIVEWSDEYAQWMFVDLDDSCWDKTMKNIEVIGNIYENPELLEME